MFGSGMNLITTIIGFGMSATFIVFVCTRLICGRISRRQSRQMFEIESGIDLEQPEHRINGLDSVMVAAIPTMKFHSEAFTSSEEDTQCSICLSEYQENEVLRIMPKCGHSFHLSCIDIWLRKQSTCPVCRLSVQESIENKQRRPAMLGRDQNSDSSEISLEHSRQWFLRTAERSQVAAMSDDPVREWILSEGKATKIKGISPIGGGCINRATRYDTDAGSFFVKTNRSIGPSMFEGEALSLNAMYETGSIRVPKPYKVGSLPTGGSYIIMEFIEFGASRGNQSALGRKLAEMHKAAKSEKGFGFHVDNTIGSTPQINTWMSDWVEFFAEHRLGYQLKMAREQYGDPIIYERGQRLARNLGPLFKNVVIEPCLLHGDLWSGNMTYDKNGEPVILDPACYYGHNEAEFGMSWCAGFGGDFYKAYFEVMPEQPGFEERRDLYMLYHYLNHYNLFGSGYRSSAMSIIDDYLRMLNV